MYEHLGEDIGSREAKRAQADLSELIKAISQNPRPDSPVYTYMPFLRQPAFTDKEFEELLSDAEEAQENFAVLLREAEDAADNSDHLTAARKFKAILERDKNNPYLRQQTALHTYKSKAPSEPLALMNAQLILAPLEPDKSNDPETLGLSGAIHKRMWTHNEDRATLDQAILYYQKGFDLRGDYYTGENAATCLEIRSRLQDDVNEALFDRMSAAKIRRAIVDSLKIAINGPEFETRSDKLWVFATFANCLFSLGYADEATFYESRFIAENPVEWQRETYFLEKEKIKSIHLDSDKKEK